MKIVIDSVEHIYLNRYVAKYREVSFFGLCNTKKELVFKLQTKFEDIDYEFIEVNGHPSSLSFLKYIDEQLNKALVDHLLINTVTIQKDLLEEIKTSLANEKAALEYEKAAFKQEKARQYVRSTNYKDGTQRVMAIELLSSALNIVITGNDAQDYRRMAAKAHPDKQGGSDALMKMVNSLYGK